MLNPPCALPTKGMHNANGRKCAKCGSDKDITLSHVIYKSFRDILAPHFSKGEEKPNWVEYLCVPCHREYTLLEAQIIHNGFLDLARRLLALHNDFVAGKIQPPGAGT